MRLYSVWFFVYKIFLIFKFVIYFYKIIVEGMLVGGRNYEKNYVRRKIEMRVWWEIFFGGDENIL